MKNLLVVTSLVEASTGLALLLVPAWVGQLLLGEALAGPAAQMARVAGIALIALSIACWPGTPRQGMLVYNAAATLYLSFLGLTGAAHGSLLWPAVALHALFTGLLLRGLFTSAR